MDQIENEVSNNLKELYEQDREQFIALVKSLRLSNWPLSVISDMIGLSKTTVSRWEKKETSAPLPETPIYPKNRQVSEEESIILANLAKKASKVRGMTPEKSPYRVAQQELEQLLLSLYQKGVTVSELARHCGVTRRAIYQRLEKYE